MQLWVRELAHGNAAGTVLPALCHGFCLPILETANKALTKNLSANLTIETPCRIPITAQW
jgi:hypothetical protein